MTRGGAPWTWRGGGLEPWELLQSPALHAAVMFVRGKQEGEEMRKKRKEVQEKKEMEKGKIFQT
jgi:hypothetical protein